LFFEAKSDLDALAAQHAVVAPFITEWSDTSSGIHQFNGARHPLFICSHFLSFPFLPFPFTNVACQTVWAALSAEGLGASLQHYNFLPPLVEKVKAEWNIPADWLLKSQLVFGTPTAEAQEKQFKPLEDRVKVYGL
jgi:uncharacterized protein